MLDEKYDLENVSGALLRSGTACDEYRGRFDAQTHSFWNLSGGGYLLSDSVLREQLRSGECRIEDIPGYHETVAEATGAASGQLGMVAFSTVLDERSFGSCLERTFDGEVLLIGCGALGAKVATSLVRSGITGLFLLDDDLAHGRNPLWGDIGRNGLPPHRAQALCSRLINSDPGVNPYDRADIRQSLHLIRDPNLIKRAVKDAALVIDTTASGDLSEQIALWADEYQAPLVWVDVFSGGLGGLVGRHRPGKGASAQAVKQSLADWYAGSEAPVFRAGTQATGNRRNVFPDPFTDETAVAALAVYAGEIGLDLVERPEKSMYAADLYLVGLRPGWIFDAPFQVKPLRIVS